MLEKERRKKMTDALLILLTDLEFEEMSLLSFLLNQKKRQTVCNDSWYEHTLRLYDDMQFGSTFR